MKNPSSEIEEYLEMLYRFKEKNKPAKTTEIAKELKISPASVSEMFKKLEKKGLIKLKPYRGAELTKKGEEIGKRTLNKHRLLERFLLALGINRDKIHEEACILEHAVSDEVADVIETTLPLNKNLKKLTELKQGQSGKLICLLGGKGSCKRLNELGLLPGTKVKIIRCGNFCPIELEVRGSSIAIGRGLAEKIYLEVEDEKPKHSPRRKS